MIDRGMFKRSTFHQIMIGVLVTGTALIAVVGWQTLDTRIEKFHILGELSAREQLKVTDTLRELNLGGILSADLQRVQAHLEQMGWARDISIRRVWPDTLEVAMLKENPVANWGHNQFVAASGNLLELPDEYPGLPRFEVAVSSPQEAMKVFRLVSHLAAESNLRVTSLNQDNQGGWNIAFHNDLEIFLGTERLSERMQRFNRVYGQLKDSEVPAAYMDLRYNNGVAVQHVVEKPLEPVLVAKQELQSIVGLQ
ncbi:MAG: FtsQ-type POTRA domain-containing protein [Pseudomonadales bacterium]|nr:FtsQ-type POTRA domain-containing protein [Pseudomonadales bacterium]